MVAPDPRGTNRANDMLARVTPLQKVAVGAAVLTLVGGVFLLGSGGAETTMAAAYTDLDAADAAAVTDELIARNVAYELADGGRTILVPRDELYDVRVELSGEGLPSSSEGYALLDRQGLTTSEFRQRIDYQRALEGELSRTLRSIDGVSAATVHLALPEDSIFVDEPSQPTASVLVTTDTNAGVGREQVAAMVHLVSSSIKDMTPENVTIADATGRVLTDGSADPMGSTGSDAVDDFEQELAASLRTMVGRVTGMDNVAVSVKADLEQSERLETTERFASGDVEDGVVMAERTSTETYTGEGALPGDAGVLGPDGAPVAATTGGDGESSYLKDDAERTFAVDRTVEQITYAAGDVNQLSVAVLVDEAAVTPEQLASLEELVSTAAGVDPARGDLVTVTALPFEVPEVLEEDVDVVAEQAAAVAAEQQMSMIRTAIIGFVVLIALFLAYRSSRKSRREVSTPIDLAGLKEAAAPGELVAAESPTQAITPLEMGPNAALDELSAMADSNPEDVAKILQGWLADERQPS
ncbi:MAG: flagellar basal-body MS-ring/collar protein FliF [Ilumatobacter sp.]